MNIAWVLNLDADDELHDPIGYAPNAATSRRVEKFARQLHELARPGDIILRARMKVPPNEYLGEAWSPTPRALKLMLECGVRLPCAPTLDVLRRVNHRRFCAALGQVLEAARYVESLDTLQEHMARYAASTWLLKRPFGFSGRGNRRVSPTTDVASSRSWIETSFRRGEGLQAEPWVEIEREFALHGSIDADGQIRLGTPTVQECDPRGAWIGTREIKPPDLDRNEHDTLYLEAERTARALVAGSYFGPFGIDAYRWRDDRGQLHFNPRSEINARYTMGWHVGMGQWRPRDSCR
jgi:phosphoribosylaminoimidazole carboxylase (NCAIR synthetase)